MDMDLPDPIDKSCFVFARHLDGRGGARAVDASDVTTTTPWVHLDYSGRGAERYLVELGVGEYGAEALTRSDTRPRLLRLEGGLILMLRAINLNPGADPEDMVSLRFWIEPGRVISVRQRKLFSVQDVKEELDRGSGPNTPIGIVSAVVERIADRIADFVEKLEETIDAFELTTEGQSSISLRSEVAHSRRQIAHVRRYLAPQRDALETLGRESPDWLKPEVHSIREQSDRMIREVEDLDLARERSLVLQEEILNQIAQQQNSRMYVLSIVAVVFLPITFVTGLFGMNVAGLPGTESSAAFWIVAAVMAGASIGILAWLRIKQWF
jgi:zinc transporter